jgi:hypothetical protein
MSVTLQQFKNIKVFLEANPDGGYEEWHEQYRPVREKNKKNIEYPEEFEQWWCTFPASMNFVFKGKTFKGTRALRDDKAKTFETYNKAKKAAGFDDSDMLYCLKVEIESRKVTSYTHKDPTYNDFQYMKATVAYLNSGKFVYWKDEELKELSDDTESNSA